MIPETIHFVWVGSAFPARYTPYIASWFRFHPGWTIRVWNQDELVKHGLTPEPGLLPAQQVDILRIQLLVLFGGWYIDTDVVALKPLDLSNHAMVIGMEDETTVGTAVIGAIPNHPLLATFLETMPSLRRQYANWPINYQTGPQALNKLIPADGSIHIMPPKAFYPHHYQHGKLTIADVSPERFPDSYACHCWHASWKKESQ